MRKKWILVLILFLGLIPFVGISVVPLFSAIFSAPSAQVSPSPAASVANQKAELLAQEKGFQLVLEREPDNPTALEGLVRTRLLLIQTGDRKVDIVIDPLEKLAKLRPEETKYKVLLAQAQQQVGNREAAAQIYRSVLATKPGDMNALQGLALLQLQQGRPAAAIGLLESTLKTADKANAIQPGSIDVPAVKLLLTDVYRAEKRFDEAIAIFDQLAKENKNDFRPVLGKALVLLEQGKKTEASPLINSALALAPVEYKDQINQLKLQAEAPPAPAASPAVPSGQPLLPEFDPKLSPSPAPASPQPSPNF
jgi:tetratricopeptide (TPR) repeat protein